MPIAKSLSMPLEVKDRDYSSVCKEKSLRGKQKASPGSYPWIVSFFKIPRCEFDKLNEAHFASGTLIGKGDWVLTVAHIFPPSAQWRDSSRFTDPNYLASMTVKAGDYYNRGKFRFRQFSCESTK